MFNQFKKTALVAAAGLAFVATPAFAADGNPATEVGTAKVRILDALSIDATDGTLDFGLLVKGSAVVAASFYDFGINADGTRGVCGSNWTCSGTTTAANFVVSGTGGADVQVTVDASVDLDGDPLDNVLVAALELDGDTDGDQSVDVTLDSTTGEATFTVGGTLTVRGDVATGVYSETFNVSAEYL